MLWKFIRKGKRKSKPKSNRVRPALEQLEDLTLPAPMVTVTSPSPTAIEYGNGGGPQAAALNFMRTETAGSLTVNLQVSGTATSGFDYITLPTTVTFAAGANMATLWVTPIQDSLPDPENVTVTVASGMGYMVGSPASAMVMITDGNPPALPTVTITATDASAGEVGPNPGSFTVSRTGSTATALTVSLGISGTATNGTDYSSIPSSVVISAGSASAIIYVSPIADSLTEGSESATLSVQASASYTQGSPSSATVMIADTPVNHAPSIAPQTFSLNENAPQGSPVGTVAASDSDAGQSLAFAITAGNGEGVFSILPTGQIAVANSALLDFETHPSFSLTVQVSDNGTPSLSNSATITINLNNVNEAPAISPQSLSVDENSPDGTVVGTVAASDHDAGQTLNYAITAGDPNGAFEIDSSTGEITVADSELLDFETTPFFWLMVQVTDSGSPALSSSAIVIVSVNDVAPDPHDDHYQVLHDRILDTYGDMLAGVLENDGGDASQITSNTQPAHGYLALFDDGHFVYVPDAGFLGTDTFTYSLWDGTTSVDASVEITVTNEATTPAADSFTVPAAVAIDSSLMGWASLLANDANPDDDALSVVSFVAPESGSLTVYQDGYFTFDPGDGFLGTVTFEYTVSDGVSESTASATLTVVNHAPTAADDAYAVAHGQVLNTILDSAPSLLANDTDVDPQDLEVVQVSQPAHGVVTLLGDGHFKYEAAASFAGTDSFTYVVSDGIAQATGAVTIAVTNTAPQAAADSYMVPKNHVLNSALQNLSSVLANDSDADSDSFAVVSYTQPGHGTVAMDGQGNFVYDPVEDFVGSDSFTYTIGDGPSSVTAAVALTVVHANQAPVAQNDGPLTVGHNQTLNSQQQGLPSLLANDSDPDGDFLLIVSYTQPAHGTVTVGSDGHFVYVPENDHAGQVSFSYTITDGTEQATAQVQLEVLNAPPVAEDVFFVASAGQALSGTLNASDPEGGALTYVLVAGPGSGQVTLNSNGTFVYIAQASFAGQTQFTYRVSDGTSLSDIATVSIDVTHTALFDGGVDGTGTSWADAVNWQGDVLPDQWSRVVIGPAFQVTLNSAAGPVTIYSLEGGGELINHGNLTLKADSSFMGRFSSWNTLELSAGVTFSAGWTVDLSGTINLALDSTFNLGAPMLASSIQQLTVAGDGVFQVGGFMSLAGSSSIANLALVGGSIGGPGNLTVGNSFLWTGGALDGIGTLTISADAVMTVDAGGGKAIHGRTLVNDGRIDWLADDNIWADGGSLQNHGSIYLLADGGLNPAFPAAPGFNVVNQGTIYRQESYGNVSWGVQDFLNQGVIQVDTGQFEINGWTFENSATVNVSDGRFKLRAGGTSGGIFTVTSTEGVLEFASSHTVSGSVSAIGSVLVSGGTLTVDGSYTADTTSIAYGTLCFTNNVTLPKLLLSGHGVLTGSGNVTISERMVWSSGTMEGGATTTINGGAFLIISEEAGGSWNKSLGVQGGAKRDLVNNGTILWYDSNVSLYGSALTNHGTFKVLGNNYLWGDANSLLVNDNTICKGDSDPANSGISAGWTTFELAFQHNGGTLEVYAGRLWLKEATVAAPIKLAENTELQLARLARFNVGSSISGITALPAGGAGYLGSYKVGVVSVTGNGELQVNTALTIPKLVLNMGLISGPATLTVSAYLDWKGGNMMGPGRTEIGSGGILFGSGEGPKGLQGRILNNLGRVAWSAGRANVFADAPEGSGVTLQNREHILRGYRQRANAAGDVYMAELTRLRGNGEDPAVGSLLAAENDANAQYDTEEEALSDNFGWLQALAEAEYDDAIAAATAGLAAAPAGDFQAEDQYWSDVTDAEETRDQAIATAAQSYFTREASLYQSYHDSVKSARGTYQGEVAVALQEYRQALWNAARVAQPDLLARHFNRAAVTSLSIEALAADLRGLIHGQANSFSNSFPPGHAGPAETAPPTVAYFLSQFTADVRASVQIAYKRLPPLGETPSPRLVDDIMAQLSSTRAGQALDSLASGVVRPPPPSVWDHIGSWIDNTVQNVNNTVSGAANWLGNAWDAAVSAVQGFDLDAAWDATTSFVTNTAQQMVEDPIGFAQTVGVGLINTTTVVANTFTFGLIPTLNQHASELGANNGFYRFVQISAVVGREVIIGMATGGAVNLAANAAIRAGRITSSMLVRIGGQRVVDAAARAAPAVACRLTSAQRLAQPFQLYSNVANMASNLSAMQQALESGDYETAAALMARSAGMVPGTLLAARETARFANAARDLNPQRISRYLAACFASGTPILWEHGVKNIEDFKVGDKVWARDEDCSDGPLTLKPIEECFDKTGRILHVHLNGQIIRTTDEHPFWVVHKGWTKAVALQPGDLLLADDGTQIPVEEVLDTGEWETVYNFRVADFHTYFVGISADGPFVWAHNESCSSRFVHDQYVNRVRGTVAPQADRTFRLPWASGRSGRRIYDDYNPATRTAYEGNTTPWSIMTQRQFDRKMDQIGADFALL